MSGSLAVDRRPTITEPLSGIELRLAVARVLELSDEPPFMQADEWEDMGDSTYTGRIYIGGHLARVIHWPPDYDTDERLAFEAWKQATRGTDARLDISIWPDGDVVAILLPDRPFYGLAVGYAVAEAICRVLVEWHRGKEADDEPL